MEGWIKAHRSLTEHWLWKDKPFSRGQAWIDLLLLANHEVKKTILNGALTTVDRGEHVTSILKLSERWGWGRKKTSRFLDDLENDQMITQKRTAHSTTVTIVKYGVYQSKEQPKEQPRNSRGTAEEQPRNTNKNEKNEKNEKKVIKNIVRFTPPDMDTVRDYCKERGNNVDPQTFIDFYTSKGWMVGKNKMKDWQAAVRTWEKNNKGQTRQELTAKRDPVSEVDNW